MKFVKVRSNKRFVPLSLSLTSNVGFIPTVVPLVFCEMHVSHACISIFRMKKVVSTKLLLSVFKDLLYNLCLLTLRPPWSGLEIGSIYGID